MSIVGADPRRSSSQVSWTWLLVRDTTCIGNQRMPSARWIQGLLLRLAFSLIPCSSPECRTSRWASFPFLNRNLRNPQVFHNLMRIKLLIRNCEEGNADASAIRAVLSVKNSEEAEPITWQEGTRF
jgi:hypothetical protein